MNETITNEALDLIVFADDCKCTANHERDDKVTCSTDITHWRVSCERRGLICANAAKYMLSMLDAGLYSCILCGRDAEKCWKVIPV